MSAVDFEEMRKELIRLYEEFLENPEDEVISKKIIAYELIYGGLSSYNDILKSRPVPIDVERALNGLSTIYQYGLWDDSHKAFSNDRIISAAKSVLEDLKKSE